MPLTLTSINLNHLKGDAMNMPATKIQAYQLSLDRDFNVPPEKVFQAWTEPEILARWFGPDGAAIQSAEIDLQIGGEYRLTLKEPDGSVAVLHGKYRKIDPPHDLVFTWILDGQACAGSDGQYAETVVTLAFQDQGGATRLVLTHDFLPTEESRDGHFMGWTDSLESLAKHFG